MDGHGFIRSIRLERDRVASFETYPFAIPSIRELGELALDPRITFLVGENGSGKSTLIEAIAVACGYNPEGGTRNFKFSTRSSESELHGFLRVARSARRPRAGFFLRAESLFNVASEIERLDAEPGGPKIVDAYGGVSLHEQSHGESFLAIATHGFRPDGLYILDEPEAALSPQRQLSLLSLMYSLAERGRAQFVVATHSPILMSHPGALLYQLGPAGIARIAYEDTEQFRITRDFLNHRESFFKHLLAP